ncbi:MAG: hypothetical protein U0230_06435 [Polyangiales bacterium]
MSARGRMRPPNASELSAYVKQAVLVVTPRRTPAPVFDGPRAVVFVHGFLGASALLDPLATRVRRELGLPTLQFGYGSVGRFESIAERLAAFVEHRVPRGVGVSLVGHSLGGLLCRWYVQELEGHRRADRLVTIATPHAGTRIAELVPTALAAALRPGSPVVRRLEAAEGRARLPRTTAIFGGDDTVVHPVTNAASLAEAVVHHLDAVGHNGLLYDHRTHALVLDALREPGA